MDSGGTRYALGIDSSTQGCSGVILDLETFGTVAEARVRYRDDPRLAGYGLGKGAPILPPLEDGEASQPAALYADALDALFQDLPADLLARVDVMNVSAQQHGQVWISGRGRRAIADLRRPAVAGSTRAGLAVRLEGGFALDRAPIWMSANTRAEADAIRDAMGGSRAVTARSGSDSPLRFSGAALARMAGLFPSAFGNTATVHLISSFIAALLSGNPDAPIDWGNGSGTGLMDWKLRAWDGELLAATAAATRTAAGPLPGGAEALRTRLPALRHPLANIGTIAEYFTARYGVNPGCAVVASSGDNPQSKVLAPGVMLSLGTSFVIMGEGGEPLPSANAMYDGLGRPFLFGCRTNGSLTLERIRADHGAADDFGSAEAALASVAPGSVLRILQVSEESFPRSPAMNVGAAGEFACDYAGAVDASLGLLELASRSFAGGGLPITATGGAAASRGVLRRAASIWGRTILPIADAGAALGAAVAAACALAPAASRDSLVDRARLACARPGAPVEPEPALLRAYRAPGAYLDRLKDAFIRSGGALD